MDENNELTARGLKECIVKQFQDLTTSERTIARARQELGWVHQTAKYCQLVRETNKIEFRIGYSPKPPAPVEVSLL